MRKYHVLKYTLTQMKWLITKIKNISLLLTKRLLSVTYANTGV